MTVRNCGLQQPSRSLELIRGFKEVTTPPVTNAKHTSIYYIYIVFGDKMVFQLLCVTDFTFTHKHETFQIPLNCCKFLSHISPSDVCSFRFSFSLSLLFPIFFIHTFFVPSCLCYFPLLVSLLTIFISCL